GGGGGGRPRGGGGGGGPATTWPSSRPRAGRAPPAGVWTWRRERERAVRAPLRRRPRPRGRDHQPGAPVRADGGEVPRPDGGDGSGGRHPLPGRRGTADPGGAGHARPERGGRRRLSAVPRPLPPRTGHPGGAPPEPGRGR